MITPKEAVGKSVEYLRELSLDEPEDLRVEEVEIDNGHWLITLGFRGERLVAGPGIEQQPLFGRSNVNYAEAHRQYDREYRLFRIRSEDGEVEVMKKRVESDW